MLLKDIAKITTGSTAPKGKYFSNNGLPFIRAGHLETLINKNNISELPKIGDETGKQLKLKKVKKGTILFAKSGMSSTKNRVYICTEDAYIVSHLAAIYPNNSVLNNYYLKYFLAWFKPSKLIIDESYPSIRTSDIGNIQIQLPSLKNQIKIVKILDQARFLIKKRQAQIEALDQLMQSVFLEMFGDPYKNPNNWPIGTIKDITLKTQYGTSKKASENNGKYPILRMGNITNNGLLDFIDMKYIDLDDSEAEKYLVHKGDLLFNRTNSKELVGKTAVYHEEKPIAFAGYLIKLVPNENANSEFISGYLNSKYGKALLYSMAKNIVGMANINAEELKNIKIYIPPRDLQDKFASINSIILQRRELLFKGLGLLEENLNSLMQRAFKGELFTEETVSNH